MKGVYKFQETPDHVRLNQEDVVLVGQINGVSVETPGHVRLSRADRIGRDPAEKFQLRPLVMYD